jgi:hypothetical protein
MKTRLAFVLSFVVLPACAATAKNMHPIANTGAMRPPPGRALVVFVRPGSFAMSMLFTVVDEQGRYLGESQPTSHFAVALPPGRHAFIAWGEDTAGMVADLAPDRTYFVKVDPKWGLLSARVDLVAVRPGTEDWQEISAWLQGTTRLEPDPVSGQAWLAAGAASVAERVRRGLEHLTQYDAAELDARTIRAADGVLP